MIGERVFEKFSMYPVEVKSLVKKINGSIAGRRFLPKINMPFKQTELYFAGFIARQIITIKQKTSKNEFFIFSLFDRNLLIIYNNLCYNKNCMFSMLRLF